MRLPPVVISGVVLALAQTACVRTELVPASASELRDTITVIGEGEAKGVPDIAKLQLGVEARSADAATAVEAANARMRAVIDALKALGVQPEDLQTSEFNIHSEHVDPEQPLPMDMSESVVQDQPVSAPTAPDQKATSAGAATEMARSLPPRPPARPSRLVYRVANMLHVTLRDLAKLGEVLDRAVIAGANQAWGVSFTVDDDTALAEKARAESVADARAQAQALAKLTGVQLGRVVAISDADAGGPGPVMQAAHMRDQAEGVPFQSGQVALQRRVRVVFAIASADDADD
jgi:uncharacterized protein YggE